MLTQSAVGFCLLDGHLHAGETMFLCCSNREGQRGTVNAIFFADTKASKKVWQEMVFTNLLHRS